MPGDNTGPEDLMASHAMTGCRQLVTETGSSHTKHMTISGMTTT
jgi:hypothetical protein